MLKLPEIIGEGLVPLIEKGQFNSPEMTKLLNKYTQPMIAAQIDCLIGLQPLSLLDSIIKTCPRNN